ncbi:hypothetical protein D3C76_1837000 [compost metagenome]
MQHGNYQFRFQTSVNINCQISGTNQLDSIISVAMHGCQKVAAVALIKTEILVDAAVRPIC